MTLNTNSAAAEDLDWKRAHLEQDSAEFTGDDHADDAARTLRTGNGSRRSVWVPRSVVGSIAGAAQGIRAQRQWRAARDVRETIQRIRKLPPAGTSTEQWWRSTAADILRKSGPTGKDGALGQLHGHLFEHCDIRDYNLRRGGIYRLVQRSNPHNPGFDASRIDANGKFAGAVQLKLGPGGIPKAIKKLEAYKPGTAKKATFRVPADQFEACKQAANSQTTVKASKLTRKTITRVANDGLRDLAAHGKAATSLSRQASRAAAKSAAVSIAVGGLVDLHALVHGNLNARQFGARRGLDAAEAGAAAAATSAAVAGVAAGATYLASTAAAGTMAATAAGAVAASTVVAPAATAVVIGYGVSLAATPVRRYVTSRLHSPADIEIEEQTGGRGGPSVHSNGSGSPPAGSDG